MTATDSRASAWSDVRPGTIVTLRRGALTGEQVERTKAWTASGPYFSDSGVACIRVDTGGVVLSYPLDRVSLGWNEPALTIASTLDPEPVFTPAVDRFVGLAIGVACLYFVCIGGLGVLGWIFR